MEECQGNVVIRIDGVPAVQCRSCQEGGEPAVTLGLAMAVEVACELVFAAASDSECTLNIVARQQPAQQATPRR